MKRTWSLSILLACPTLALAQNPPQPYTPPYGSQPGPYQSPQQGPHTSSYQPAVAPPSMSTAYGGGYYGGGGGGGGTVEGNYLNGMASAISASGQAALNTSAAAVNMTQARANEIVNDQAATDAYFNMRATNRAAVAAENGPRLTAEQMTMIAQQQVPKPLNNRQMNPVSGRLQWPSFLATPPFETRRAEVDKMVSRQAELGSLPYGDQTKVRDIIDSMYDDLKAQIDNVPTQDYIASRTFLNSLKFETTRSQL